MIGDVICSEFNIFGHKPLAAIQHFQIMSSGEGFSVEVVSFGGGI